MEFCIYKTRGCRKTGTRNDLHRMNNMKEHRRHRHNRQRLKLKISLDKPQNAFSTRWNVVRVADGISDQKLTCRQQGQEPLPAI
jgi:hypothetical protein